MATEERLGDFNPTTCRERLEQRKETQPICPEVHCNEFQESPLYHEACGEKAMYSPVQTLGCYNPVTNQWAWAPAGEIKKLCKEKAKQDPNWELEQCFCCCSCFANVTPIGLPDGQQRPIAEIEVGDMVLAGTVSSDEVEWEPATVGFSQGTEGGSQPAMVYLVYGDGDGLVASPDQPMMLADGSLTTAARLAPGQDLMGVDGQPVTLSLVSIGEYKGGVHHIATNPDWEGSIDKHLIQANGLVAGDFTLQLHFPHLPSSEKVADWEALPELGTSEYQQSYSHLMQLGESEVYAAGEENDASVDPELFAVYGPEAELPMGTQSFITEAQAEDILQNGQQAPITEQSGYSLAQQAIALVSGFYRDYTYYIDWNRNEPNVYAFEQYGQKIVLVSGGLARMKGIGFTALTMAVAQSIARFAAGEPKAGKYSCTGESDLYAFGVVSRKVWFGTAWLKQTMSATDQLGELFELISPENAKGNPLNVCEEPSIECREETWMAALSGSALPECAGGSPLPALKLEQASASGANEVRLVFSQSPVEASAEDTANYTLTPAAKISKASIDAEKNFIVNLQVSDLEPGKYTLTCSHLKSVFGGKLEPDPASVEFEVAPEGA